MDKVVQRMQLRDRAKVWRLLRVMADDEKRFTLGRRDKVWVILKDEKPTSEIVLRRRDGLLFLLVTGTGSAFPVLKEGA